MGTEKKEHSRSSILQFFKVPEFLPKKFGGGMPPLPTLIPDQPATPLEQNYIDDSVESDLLEIGKSAIRASQLQGYFPLGYSSSSRKLSLNPKHFSFIWTIFSLAFQILSGALFMYLGSDVYKRLHVFRITEKLALSIASISISSMLLGRRFYGLLCYKHTLKFWSEFLRIIRKFKRHEGEGVLKSPIFIWIKTSIDRTVLENLVLTTFFGLYFIVTKVVNNLPEVGTKWNLPSYVGHAVGAVSWSVMGCAHVFITAWTTFPLKIIQGLLESLKQELDLQIFLKSHKLRQSWIEDYRQVSRLLKLYTNYFEKSLMIEIAYNAIQILCQCFSAFSWIIAGMITASISRGIPIFFSLRTIYQLTSEAERICEFHGEIYAKLCQVGTDLEDEAMKGKVNLMLNEMALDGLTVQPGRYFTLNRRLITSIMSTVTTFVIILIQFRDGEGR